MQSTFNDFIVPGLFQNSYSARTLTFESDVTYEDGGYCQIGNLVIVQFRFTLTANYAGGTAKTLASGFPVPLQNTNLVPYLASSRPIYAYINSTGRLTLNTTSSQISSGWTTTIGGCYLTRAGAYTPTAYKTPEPVNLSIESSFSNKISIYRNNSYKIGRLVQISVILDINTVVSGNDLIITNNPPPLYRDTGNTTLPLEKVAIVDIPSWNNARLRVCPGGMQLYMPNTTGQYTFTGMYIAAE